MPKRLGWVIVGMMLFSVGCSRNAGSVEMTPNQNVGSTAPVDQPAANNLASRELVVNGVGLGSERTEVEKALGTPEKVEKAAQQHLEFLHYPSKGLTVGISSDERVHILSVSAPASAWTLSGIGIGSSMDDVKRAYGNPNGEGNYPLKSDQKNVFLEVEGKNNQVTLLYASWGYK